MRRTADAASNQSAAALGTLVSALACDRRLAKPITDLSADLVRAHGLAPLAHRAGVPGFKPSYLAAALAAERRHDVLREVTAELSKRDIPVMLLKGIAYVHGLYDDPAVRPMDDIDLLVPRDRMERAVSVLEGCGYRRVDPGAERSPAHHAVTMQREDSSIDLHRSIVQPLRSSLDTSALWRRARYLETARAHLPDPIDEALLQLASIGRSELVARAISYVDAARLLHRLGAADLDVLSNRAQAARLARLVGSARAMTECLARGGDQLTSMPAALRLLLPSPAEILSGNEPVRPRRIACKLALTEGPREWLGLAATFVLDRAQHLHARQLNL